MVGIRSIPLDNLMNAAVKRATDIVGALILLVLTSPLMFLAAVGIKLTSKQIVSQFVYFYFFHCFRIFS